MTLEQMMAVLPLPLESYESIGLTAEGDQWALYAETQGGFNRPPITRHLVCRMTRRAGTNWSTPPRVMSTLFAVLSAHHRSMKALLT